MRGKRGTPRGHRVAAGGDLDHRRAARHRPHEVIVEGGDLNFDVVIPAAAGTMVTVPPEVLEPGADYLFEVLAIEKGGNQTITEGCFATAG
jgi:hypothetical protein